MNGLKLSPDDDSEQVPHVIAIKEIAEYVLIHFPMGVRRHFVLRNTQNQSLLSQFNATFDDNLGGCGSLVVKAWDRGWLATSSSPVPLKTCRVWERCTLNLSSARTSSRWSGVVARRRRCQLRCRSGHLTMIQKYEVRHQKPLCS
ncbi:uncharacterized protein TNCV_887021 [Trichonephila clavipes]|uniref:Uncharacterized protein n=1 Tax=Trichonephila clavipes TaxID=2585209 RepID=A0A8X6RCD4_TRICX|nr:uncharacterized protein TNCV_887021 [Trichonephila clavipes]